MFYSFGSGKLHPPHVNGLIYRRLSLISRIIFAITHNLGYIFLVTFNLEYCNTVKKLTVCTRYTRLGASSRLRFYDYAPLLKAEGIETDIHPLLGDSYIKKLYAGKKSRISGSLSLAKRMAQAPFWGNELLIEYELLPFLPINIEKLLLNKRRYVLAFDDAVWMKYRGIVCREDELCGFY